MEIMPDVEGIYALPNILEKIFEEQSINVRM